MPDESGRSGETSAGRSWRAWLHELLEDEERTTGRARLVRRVLLVLILTTVAAGILESEPSVHAAYGLLLHLIETGGVLIFTLEYAARVWSCVEDRAGRYQHPINGRLRYVATPLALIDLLAVAPFYLALVVPIDLIFLRLFRLLRILKITRYSPALGVLEVVFYNERRALLSALLVVAVAVVLAGGLIHVVEGEAQPEMFGSIPKVMWWAVVTLTTIGYGDAYPITPLGKIVGGLTALCAIGTLALPTAILGAGFARELQKREFVDRASMVTRVPVFRYLRPAQLAEITGLLHPRVLPPRYIVVRAGEHPEAIYFIDEGKVVMRRGNRRITLGPGAFFGELAILEGRQREATVITLTPCRLLELDASDFHRLIAGDPTLREAILAETRERARRHDLGETPTLAGLQAERKGEEAASTDRPPR